MTINYINIKIQDESEWPHVALLPSYGKGRDAPDARFSSLIFGTNLTDVVITGIKIKPKIYFFKF